MDEWGVGIIRMLSLGRGGIRRVGWKEVDGCLACSTTIDCIELLFFGSRTEFL